LVNAVWSSHGFPLSWPSKAFTAEVAEYAEKRKIFKTGLIRLLGDLGVLGGESL
jgi:hypothetical protein